MEFFDAPLDHDENSDQTLSELESGMGIDDEIHAEWIDEIHRRVAAYDRGESIPLEFDEAMENLRRALAARRPSEVDPVF